MTVDRKRSPRERLLAAADELFYAEGVHTVGIDRIIERAGVAKASLYSAFGGKEELIRAYLAARQASAIGRLRRAVDQHAEPRARLLAVFDEQGTIFAEPGFHGCPFAAASAEAPRGGLIEQATAEYRAELRALFTELATATGAANPATLASQLLMLLDGAGLAAQLDQDPTTAALVKAAAEALLPRQPQAG